jgi:hypothetical protein
MGIAHTKKVLRVLCRAGIPTFIFGAHGIGKTSAAYQMYHEGADEHQQTALPEQAIIDSLKASRGGADIDFDVRALSSLDGKHLARANADLNGYGFWSMSAPNITLEELVGMPDVEDRGGIWRESYWRAQDVASNLLVARAKGLIEEGLVVEHRFNKVDDELAALTAKIWARNCKLMGITDHDKNHRVLRYLRMYGLMPDPRHKGGGVWLIDEPNRGFEEVEKGLMQILLEGRYLDYEVPDGIWIVMSANPPDGDYKVRPMDIATFDRGAVLTVESDKTEWLEWATKRGIGEQARVFVEKHGDKLLNSYEKKLDLSTITNDGTNRSIEYADRAFRCMTEEEVRQVGPTVARSILGPEAGNMWHKEWTEKVHRALSVKEVTSSYGWKKSMTIEDEKDFKQWKGTKVRKRLMSMINKENVKTELVRITLAEIQEWVSEFDKDLKKRGSTKTNPKHNDEERGMILNVMLFLYDLPVDLSRQFIMHSVDERFYRLMFWTGHYPICESLYDKIEVEYQDVGGGKGEE